MMKMKTAMERLNDLIKQKNSRICAGLNLTWENIPDVVKMQYIEDECDQRKSTIYDYCMQYIEAVCDIVPAIKINSACFENEAMEDDFFAVAMEAKERGLFVIGDIKRADIGPASMQYVEAYLCADSPFDAVTVNPYLGTDGVMPFLARASKNEKGVFVLVKTSNKSSKELQDLKLEDGRFVYEAVADLAVDWSIQIIAESDKAIGCERYNSVGAVVGTTYPEQAENLKNRMMNIFRLVPDYGTQGTTADDIVVNFDDDGLGAIINSSRIMNAYKSDCWKRLYNEQTWAEAAKAEAIRETAEINEAIERRVRSKE